MSNILDVFWLDNDNATSLGVDVGKVTKQVLILVAILISVSTALVGPVMFFGLLVANLAKEFFSYLSSSYFATGKQFNGNVDVAFRTMGYRKHI